LLLLAGFQVLPVNGLLWTLCRSTRWSVLCGCYVVKQYLSWGYPQRIWHITLNLRAFTADLNLSTG